MKKIIHLLWILVYSKKDSGSWHLLCLVWEGRVKMVLLHWWHTSNLCWIYCKEIIHTNQSFIHVVQSLTYRIIASPSGKRWQSSLRMHLQQIPVFCVVVVVVFYFTSYCIWLVNVKVMSSFFMKDGLTALCSTYSMASFILLI